MDRVEKSGKTVDEALDAAVQDLGVTRDEVDYKILDVPSKALFGIIGGKEARLDVWIRKAEPGDLAKAFLAEVLKAMNLSVYIEKVSGEENVTLNIRGDDLGILIGKHGQTLDALQYLTNLAAQKDVRERIRIIVDVEDYRRRRADTLEQLALRVAERVKRSGQKVALEPMTPHERKIIHMSLQDDPTFETFSEGEEPYRRVVISLRK